MAKGKVALVGAGPGDPRLLTLRGRELLEKADVVVYDRLISDEILSHAKQAKLLYVGKEQGHHPVPQHEINAMLAREATEADLVVRLKGGDPYVFGRGGEEGEYLVEQGFEIEVVPGVTSAIAALSYAGIPATSRNIAQSVSIITGHARADGELEINFEALSKTGGTLVFLMSVTSLPDISGRLLEAGMDPSTPAAIVQNGTLPSQRRVAGTLSTIVEDAQAANVQSPAIVVVGDVCACVDALDWYSRLPLFGQTVLVTRPRDTAGALSTKLREAGADVVSLPCIDTHAILDKSVQDAVDQLVLGKYTWLVLTSVRGVSALFEALDNTGLDARALSKVKIACVGASTGEALAKHGIRADYTPEHYDGAHLGEGLADFLETSDCVLIFRAKNAAPGLTEALDAANVACKDVAAYETVPVSDDRAAKEVSAKVAAEEIGYAAFTSASAVRAFAKAVPEAANSKIIAVCIGPSSEKAAKNLGLRTIVAKNASLDALVCAIVDDIQS